MTTLPKHSLQGSDLAQKTVLIVDDNSDYLVLLNCHLERHFGCRIVKANSGLEAAALLLRQEIDLVISDNHMSEGSGEWLHQFIKGHRPALPLIIFTSDPASYKWSYDEVLRAVIRKPNFSDLWNLTTEIWNAKNEGTVCACSSQDLAVGGNDVGV